MSKTLSSRAACALGLVGARLLVSRVNIQDIVEWMRLQGIEPGDEELWSDEWITSSAAFLEDPFVARHFTCLHRSLAAWFVLGSRARKCVLHIGAKPEVDGTTHMHAWVDLTSMSDVRFTLFHEPGFHSVVEYEFRER